MWQDEVETALGALSGDGDGAVTHYIYPAVWPEGPLITYAGLGEAPERFADDGSYLVRLEVAVDLWTSAAAELKDMAPGILEAMEAIGFQRTYCADLYDPQRGLYRKAMRFRRMEARVSA